MVAQRLAARGHELRELVAQRRRQRVEAGQQPSREAKTDATGGGPVDHPPRLECGGFVVQASAASAASTAARPNTSARSMCWALTNSRLDGEYGLKR